MCPVGRETLKWCTSPMYKPKPKAVLLLGPTGVGKTALSLKLAEAVNGEIVSADSRLFYRGMDIGTAKPTLHERKRVPHHLVDVADPDEHWSLSRFLEAADAAIVDIARRGKVPIIVGGTGQFVRALLEGWEIPEIDEKPRLRQALLALAETQGSARLHAWLEGVDPEAAQKIDGRNVRRTVRAIEVILSTGRKFSAQRMATGARYEFIVLGLTLPRPMLYQRIDERVDAMFAAGLLDEVRGLLKKYPPDSRCFSAIGYPQAIRVLKGEMTEGEAKIEIKRRTRVFVRGQAAWFRHDAPGITWIEQDETADVRAVNAVREFIGIR